MYIIYISLPWQISVGIVLLPHFTLLGNGCGLFAIFNRWVRMAEQRMGWYQTMRTPSTLWHVRTRVISKSRGNRIKLDTRYSWTKDIHSTFILRFVVAFWNKYMCAMILVKLCTWLFTSSSRGIWNQPQTFLFDWDITNNIIVMGTQWIYIYMYT